MLTPALPLLAALTLAAPLPAGAHAEAGTVVGNAELQTIAGGQDHLLSARVKANVVVFFRSGQERSVDALKMLATCEKEFASRPVRWVGVVSSSETPADVKALVAETGIAMPVLVDEGDRLYGELGIRTHPMVAIVDGQFRVVAIEMYRQIDYCEIVKGRIRLMLGEIDQAAMAKIVEPPRSSMPGDDPRDVARRDLNLGRMLLLRKQYDQALAAAQKALERAPIAAAFTLRGDVHAAQGSCARALKEYAQALKLDPKDAGASAGQARCAAKK